MEKKSLIGVDFDELNEIGTKAFQEAAEETAEAMKVLAGKKEDGSKSSNATTAARCSDFLYDKDGLPD